MVCCGVESLMTYPKPPGCRYFGTAPAPEPRQVLILSAALSSLPRHRLRLSKRQHPDLDAMLRALIERNPGSKSAACIVPA